MDDRQTKEGGHSFVTIQSTNPDHKLQKMKGDDDDIVRVAQRVYLCHG